MKSRLLAGVGLRRSWAAVIVVSVCLMSWTLSVSAEEDNTTREPDAESSEVPVSAEPPSGPQQKQPADATASLALAEAQSETDQRLTELEQRNAALEDELEMLREDQAWAQQQIDKTMALTSRLSGYVDFGFFHVAGDGRGIRPDIGYENFPQYEGIVADSWVFMGDPLSTAINSRGDPADVEESRAVTFEQIGNDGQPTFVLNNINLQLFAGVGDNLTINGMVDFVPRGRDASRADGSAVGDFVDIKLGYVDYRLDIPGGHLQLFAGKFDSVLGIEYRTQESPQRLTVTPSLICRYTCGRPLGLKARANLLDSALVFNAAVTNGSHSSETFPIYDETDSNAAKTAAGRLSYEFDVAAGLEFGASGSYGAQDLQTEDATTHWHYGFDARLDLVDLVVAAEFVQGQLNGRTEEGQAPCGLAPCLEYKGAYGLAGYRATNWLMPYSRIDWRNALHQSGASFVYVSDLVRPMAGLRFDLGTHIVVKAEYIWNVELGDVPEFANNVFASSLVGKF